MNKSNKVKSIKKKSKRWSFQYGKHKRLNIVLGFWINKPTSLSSHFWFDFEIKILNIWLGFNIDKTLGRKINIRKSYKMYKNYSINR
tara:strand:- start:2037 stop:2297 length:261 start_codon:yes stop_codon:yes gene_type:complete